jgi:hypothetical protein
MHQPNTPRLGSPRLDLGDEIIPHNSSGTSAMNSGRRMASQLTESHERLSARVTEVREFDLVQRDQGSLDPMGGRPEREVGWQPLAKGRGGLRADDRWRRAGVQSANNIEPLRIGRAEKRFSALHERLECQGQPRLGGIRARCVGEKTRRHDADDHRRSAVQGHRPADDGRVCVIVRLPRRVAQDDRHPRRRRAAFTRFEG